MKKNDNIKGKKYELVLVLSPRLGEGEQKQLLDGVRKELKKAKSSEIEEKSWGEKAFIYPIKGHLKGHYFFWKVVFLQSPHLEEINVFLNREESILRYLWVKSKEKHG